MRRLRVPGQLTGDLGRFGGGEPGEQRQRDPVVGIGGLGVVTPGGDAGQPLVCARLLVPVAELSCQRQRLLVRGLCGRQVVLAAVRASQVVQRLDLEFAHGGAAGDLERFVQVRDASFGLAEFDEHGTELAQAVGLGRRIPVGARDAQPAFDHARPRPAADPSARAPGRH